MKKAYKKNAISSGLILPLLLSLSLFSCRNNVIDLESPENVQDGIYGFSLNTGENPVLSENYNAEISGRTVYISLPPGTDRSALVPRFEIRGKGLQVNGLWQNSGQSAHDFTVPVRYDLVRADNRRIQYTVIAGYGDYSGTDLYSFYFDAGLNPALTGTVSAEFDGDRIFLTFPFGTDLSALVLSFDLPAGGVLYRDDQVLTSGVTALDLRERVSLRLDMAGSYTKIYNIEAVVAGQTEVYVSAGGSDAGGNGSQINPLATIPFARDYAAARGIREIRISWGTYTMPAPLVLTDNMTLKGGYDPADWSSRPYISPGDRQAQLTVITQNSGAAGTATAPLGTLIYDGSGISSRSVLEGLTVRADATGGADLTAAVSVLNGAAPKILFSDLYGAPTALGAGVYVRGSAPSLLSCVIAGGAVNGSLGLFVSSGGSPTAVSCRISSDQGALPGEGSALQLEGSSPGGRYYNNYLFGRGSVSGSAVKLESSGGEFINNIFDAEPAGPESIGFHETGSGNYPAVLEFNVFSRGSTSLYRSAGGADYSTAEEINNLSQAGSAAGNVVLPFAGFDAYNMPDLPPAAAFGAKTLSSAWSRDLYNNPRSESGDRGWSMGPVETDSTSLEGEVLHVNDNGDLADGWWNSLNLREAVMITNSWGPAKRIEILTGGTIFLTKEIVITSDLELIASGGVLLDGGGMNRFLRIDDGLPSVRKSVILGLVGFRWGGGQSPGSGTDGLGGAVFSREDLYLLGCQFLSNGSQYGGAVYQDGGSLNLINCVFDQNTAAGAGGALYLKEAGGNGINLVFAGNQATGAPGYGGAVLSENSSFNLSHATFVNNNASGSGGGLYKSGSAGMTVGNSIFHLNTAPSSADAYNGGGLTIARSFVQPGSAHVTTGVTDQDPQLMSTVMPAGPDGNWGTQDDSFRLQPSSPALDYGSADYLPADWPDLDGDGDTSEKFPQDLTGTSRVLGSAPDAGAYENLNLGDLLGYGVITSGFSPERDFNSVDVNGNLVALCDSEGRVILMDHQPAGDTLSELKVLTFSVKLNRVYLRGNYLYVLRNDQRISIYDVSSPSSPNGPHTVSTAGVNPLSLAFSGSYAYAGGDGSQPYAVLDVSDPMAAVMLGTFGTPAFGYDMAVFGTTLYGGDGDGNTIKVFDITTPAAPDDTPPDLNPLAVDPEVMTLYGNFLLVSSGGQGVMSLDLSSGPPPTQSPAQNGGPVSPGFHGGTADGTYYYDIASSGSAGVNSILRVIDAAGLTPGTTPGVPATWQVDNFMAPREIHAANNRLYAADGTRGFYILNLDSPMTGTYTARYMPGMDWAWDGAAKDDYLFIAGGLAGVRIYDMANPSSPREIITGNKIGHDVVKVLVYGDYLFYMDRKNGVVYKYSVSNPENPNYITEYSTGDTSSMDMAASGGHLYVTSNADIRVLEMDDYTDLFSVNTIAGVNPEAFGLGDGRLLAASGSTCEVYGLSIPSNPISLGTFAALGFSGVKDIAVRAGYAYFMHSGGVGVGNTATYSIESVFSGTFGGGSSNVMGGVLYGHVLICSVWSSTAANNGMSMVDTSTPAALSELKSVPSGGSSGGYGILMEGELIYLMDSRSGVTVYGP